ncbi:MAG: hypothetical protein R3B72_16680 [Polyangiaceae bacterium]
MGDFGAITSQHIIYIPMVLIIGLAIGYAAGARAVRAELERKRERMKE